MTPDAIGFGFYDPKDLNSLRENLEKGMSANEAAGFSGNVYPLGRLKRVRMYPRKKRVVVEFRDLLLTDKDDLHFYTEIGCQEFCHLLEENMGPSWERRLAAKRNFWLTALPIVALLGVLVFLAASVALLLAGPDPVVGTDGKIRTQAESRTAGMVCGGVSLVSLVGVCFWLWAIIKRPSMVETLQPRKGN